MRVYVNRADVGGKVRIRHHDGEEAPRSEVKAVVPVVPASLLQHDLAVQVGSGEGEGGFGDEAKAGERLSLLVFIVVRDLC